jgi:hypothetical protein
MTILSENDHPFTKMDLRGDGSALSGKPLDPATTVLSLFFYHTHPHLFFLAVGFCQPRTILSNFQLLSAFSHGYPVLLRQC